MLHKEQQNSALNVYNEQEWRSKNTIMQRCDGFFRSESLYADQIRQVEVYPMEKKPNE